MKVTALKEMKQKRETLDMLLDERAEECERTVKLRAKLRTRHNENSRRSDVLAELSAALLHLHIHTKDLNKLIDEELDQEEDD